MSLTLAATLGPGDLHRNPELADVLITETLGNAGLQVQGHAAQGQQGGADHGVGTVHQPLADGFAGVAFSPEYAPGTTREEILRVAEQAASQGGGAPFSHGHDASSRPLPMSATTGTSRAAAMCIGAVSTPTKSLHRLVSAAVCVRLI